MFKESISKEEIAQLPNQGFNGVIHIIEDTIGFQKISPQLMAHKLLGFDTETKPSFKKGRKNKVALLQLSTANEAYLFRLNKFAVPDAVKQLLENTEVIKVGVAIRDDLAAINQLKPFIPGGFIELQHFVKDYHIQDNGLRKLAANILKIRISKQQQLSNWEGKTLTDAQLNYAATDAWACHQIYSQLINTI